MYREHKRNPPEFNFLEQPAPPPHNEHKDNESENKFIESERIITEYHKKIIELLEAVHQGKEIQGDELIDMCREILIEIKKRNKIDLGHQKCNRTKGFSKTQKKALLKKTRGGCPCCSGGTMGTTSRHGDPIELHHIIPREHGGKDTKDNALPICKTCHVRIHRDL
jgi:hypothetical protein